MKRISLSFFCTLISINIYAQQVDCSNIGFEEGTTRGWTLSTGGVTDNGVKRIYQSEQLITSSSRHLITTANSGNDPKITAEAIPMVAPGSDYSIRIGNTEVGGTFDRIRTSFLVTPDNTLFQYKFAVVLQQETRHEEYQKAGFSVKITDTNDNQLACGYYDIQLLKNNTVGGFREQGDLQYRNWTIGAIDLRNFVGKVVNVEVTVHGCTRRQHFGYAYFDAQCLKSEIKALSKCPDNEGYISLKAPEGFAKYTWSTGATTPIARVKGNVGDKFWVKVVPYSSLNDNCELQLDYALKHSLAEATIDTTICKGEKIKIDDTEYSTEGTFIKVIKRSICDSTVTLKLKIKPLPTFTQTLSICEGEKVTVGDSIYTKTGVYIHTFSRPKNCDSILITKLYINPLPQITITPPNATISKGDSAKLQVTINPATAYYTLQWTPPDFLSCTTCNTPWAKPVASATYTVSVINQDTKCQNKQVVKIGVACNVYIPDAFTPNNDGMNDIFFLQANECVVNINEMIIYNRWGEVVFRNENFKASDPTYGWNGNYLGQKAINDIYTYKFTVQLKDGGTSLHRGFVNLLR